VDAPCENQFTDVQQTREDTMRSNSRRHTVSSYGIICHRMKIDFNSRCLHPEFMLVQRKDSMAFVEFVRGKYVPDDMCYVRKLIGGMTVDEQELVATESFEDLWCRVWGRRLPMSSRSGSELGVARHAHETLCSMVGNLRDLVRSASSHLHEREFGFPKGRKSGGETDIACAIREFQEETGVGASCIHVYSLAPYEEVFDGGNGTLYRHVYYLARIVDMRGRPTEKPIAGSIQAQEVRSVRWFGFADMCAKFDGCPSRLNVAKRANADIFTVLDPDPTCVTFNAMAVHGVASEEVDQGEDKLFPGNT